MKKNNIFSSVSFVLLAMLASCEKEDTVNDECSLFPTRSETDIIPASEVEKYITGNYYHEDCTFSCSDSLGRVCYWNEAGKPTFEIPKMESKYNKRMASDRYISDVFLHKFDKENQVARYARTRPDLDDFPYRAVKNWWYYVENTGHFLIAMEPIIDPQSVAEEYKDSIPRLVGVDEEHFILRTEGGDAEFSHGHSTYELHVYTAVRDTVGISKDWYVDAEPVEIGVQ